MDAFVINRTGEQEDGIVLLAELFDDGGEAGGRPAFLGAPAAGVDGDAPDAGRFQSMFGGYKWQFIGHCDVL